MTIVSIDPAWAKDTAYAVFKNRELLYADKAETHSRLSSVIMTADRVVIEDPYLGQNVSTLKVLCFAVGIIIAECDRNARPYHLVSPRVWKKHFSLTRTTPERIQQQIRFQLTKSDDSDIQDAVLLGRYFIEHELLKLE